MYNGSSHAEMEKVYQSHVEEMKAKYGSREKASSVAAQDGWKHIPPPLPEDKYFRNAVVDLAMRSFNGAWLLWKNNPEAYWGFGVCTAMRGYPGEAKGYFTQAIKLNPNDALLMLDVAHNYTILGAEGDVQALDEAIEFCKGALILAVDDQHVKQSAYSQWAIALFYKRDYASAWEKIKVAEKHGWVCPENDFVTALNKKMPRPK